MSRGRKAGELRDIADEPTGLTVVSHGEVLVCGCYRDDLGVLRGVCASEGRRVRVVRKPVQVAQEVVTHLPIAVVLGIRKRDRARLNVIPVLRAAWSDLPIIVVAEEPSLELERRARQAGIFYYFVHPLDRYEVEAVLKDILRRAERASGSDAGTPSQRGPNNQDSRS